MLHLHFVLCFYIEKRIALLKLFDRYCYGLDDHCAAHGSVIKQYFWIGKIHEIPNDGKNGLRCPRLMLFPPFAIPLSLRTSIYMEIIAEQSRVGKPKVFGLQNLLIDCHHETSRDGKHHLENIVLA